MNKPKILYFGLDFFRISILDKKEYPALDILFAGLSENSPFTEFNFLGCVYSVRAVFNRDKDILFLDYDGLPVCKIEKITSKINPEIIYGVSFWGTAFLESPIFSKTIPNLLDYLGEDNYKITRIDLTLDVNLTVPAILKGIKRNNLKGNTYYDRNGEIETQYLGLKGNNKRHFVRVYNKKNDLSKKGKMSKYLEYWCHDNVSRIECQINADSCRNYRIDRSILENVNFQKKVFASLTLNKRINFFPVLSKLDFANIIIPPKRESLNTKEYHSHQMFLAYARKLYDSGINPLDVLGDCFSSTEKGGRGNPPMQHGG